MTPRSVLIIGGGVSGLATAYYLRQHGIPSVLVEKSSRLGGLVHTDRLAGCLLEAGPDSYISTKPALTELANALGLPVIGSNDSARRVFIVRGGKLVPLPKGMVMMVPSRWRPALNSELFSVGTKLRFLAELRSRPRERSADISVGELVSDHFGSEVLEYVTSPLLSGVYGGHAARLSAASVLPRFIGYERRFGSLIRGVRQEANSTPPGSLFLSLRDGMQSLVDSLQAGAAPEIVHREARQVEQTSAGWRVQVGDEWRTTQELVLACPAYVGADLLRWVDDALAANLAAIPYSSAILVTLLYESAQFGYPLHGFGFLVPPAERETIAAATWVNVKFPSRIAPGLVALRAFIVADEAERLLSAPDDDLIRLAGKDFARFMGVHGTPRLTTVYRWPRSMPQYVVGHAERQKNISAAMASHPSLHLVGNAYDGVGLPDCIRLARSVSQRIFAAQSN